MNRNLHVLSRQLKKTIGKHYRICGDAKFTSDLYQQARHDNDLAVSLAKYLIQSLENRSHAEQFAHDVGMPGYFHMYKN
jgi:hypothetical protein